MYVHGPMRPIRPCGDEYDEIIPLIKIKDHYMSVSDIESMMDDWAELSDITKTDPKPDKENEG
jgi:hypothetical protein